MRRSPALATALPLLLALGCSTEDPAGTGGGGTTGGATSATGSGGGAPLGTFLDAEPQRPGDPAKGYDALVNNGYISCGVPWTAYAQVFGGGTPDGEKLPGRTGKNADLPYYMTASTNGAGVEIVAQNCLICHAGTINGQLVVGLGAADGDFTTDISKQAGLVSLLLSDPKEKAEAERWAERIEAIAPFANPTTIGVNPADSFTAALFSHRDRKTLAWSGEAMLPLPEPYVVPVDTPPWWRMAKKNAMFYNGAGRGDHSRIEMTASTLCTDTIDEAKQIDAYFPDIAAYIASIEPPKWPFAIDAALAEKGRGVFESSCAKCHGSQGDGGVYPNLLIAVDDVGTDPTLAASTYQFASGDEYISWYNESFFGELARLEPHQGYVAPPLDGIWATAPFLHNGSVPTIEALLDSSKRPQFWTRSFDSTDYDQAAVGWNFTALPAGQDAEMDAKKKKAIYDTTKLGYSNAGHLYGDVLSADDRAAVIEYLKTL